MQQVAKKPVGIVAAMLVLAGAFVVGGATTALARVGNGWFEISANNSDGKYAHLSGWIRWYPRGKHHGGMRVNATKGGGFWDSKADGNHVYAQAKVAGYGYTTLAENFKGNGGQVQFDRVIYDPAATIVSHGAVRACVSQEYEPDDCERENMDRG